MRACVRVVCVCSVVSLYHYLSDLVTSYRNTSPSSSESPTVGGGVASNDSSQSVDDSVDGRLDTDVAVPSATSMLPGSSWSAPSIDARAPPSPVAVLTGRSVSYHNFDAVADDDDKLTRDDDDDDDRATYDGDHVDDVGSSLNDGGLVCPNVEAADDGGVPSPPTARRKGGVAKRDASRESLGGIRGGDTKNRLAAGDPRMTPTSTRASKTVSYTHLTLPTILRV